ncbi:ribonuclease HII [Microvirga massiliensis]|uniref:ribonuclease HII n=1 Tax=Microvirga massiliensis TaxID=1033741 RepID=UPI000AC36B10|nr:ribonuclease HII [Microvirga massiliensis]
MRAKGFHCIAGLDEVGRGPLAGPVVAAAVVLDLDRAPGGLADSKCLSADRRDELFALILATSRVGIASIPSSEIDRINIRQATLSAMCKALAALPCHPDLALVDGNDPPALPCATEAIIGGDATVASIAAASIVAKVVRDRLMRRLADRFPAYGFTTNVGYGTAEHRAALDQNGPTPFHRLTFGPCAKAASSLSRLIGVNSKNATESTGRQELPT